MIEIKTRDIEKGTVKIFDRSFLIAGRIKDVCTKDKYGNSTLSDENTVDEYNANCFSKSVCGDTAELIDQLKKNGCNSVRSVKHKLFAKKTGQKNLPEKSKPNVCVKYMDKTYDRAIKTANSLDKQKFKSIQKNMKTASKHVQATDKVVKKNAKTATQMSKVMLKAIIEAVKASFKAFIFAIKGLVAIIVAGGSIAIIVIVIICIIALIVYSYYGIFLAIEDTETENLQLAILEIKAEYDNQIETIKNSYIYDEVDISGSTVQWPEVLSVYAIKTTTDSANGQEIVTIDATKKAILKDIFWQMTEISYGTKLKIEEVVVQVDDGNGNKVESIHNIPKIYLYISVTHKSADEIASQFGFNESQRIQLAELLSAKNRSAWDLILNGL